MTDRRTTKSSDRTPDELFDTVERYAVNTLYEALFLVWDDFEETKEFKDYSKAHGTSKVDLKDVLDGESKLFKIFEAYCDDRGCINILISYKKWKILVTMTKYSEFMKQFKKLNPNLKCDLAESPYEWQEVDKIFKKYWDSENNKPKDLQVVVESQNQQAGKARKMALLKPKDEGIHEKTKDEKESTKAKSKSKNDEGVRNKDCDSKSEGKKKKDEKGSKTAKGK
jgi:hypothetical protein